MSDRYFFTQHEVHTGEEGWYVYLRPSNPRVRSIREAGPLSRDEAEALVERKNQEQQS